MVPTVLVAVKVCKLSPKWMAASYQRHLRWVVKVLLLETRLLQGILRGEVPDDFNGNVAGRINLVGTISSTASITSKQVFIHNFSQACSIQTSPA